MPLLEAEQRSEAWHAARAGKITASLAAACLGLDPHTSRQKAFRMIVGTQVNGSNHHMRWGEENEGQAREAYEAETGNLVAETGFWMHPTIEWLGASPDGLVGDDGLAEIKCPTNCPADVPMHHIVQMQVQMIVTQREWCDYYSWTHAGTFLRRVNKLDDGAAAALLAGLERFWLEYVQKGIEPPRKRRGQ